MSIVSDASPLINLARIGKLDLLQQLYGELFIPEAVWYEVAIKGAGQPGANEVKAATWLKVKSVTNAPLVHALRQELDAGESEVITLALELKSELLLMDERIGREVAQHLGLRSVGLIGVIVEAKHKGMLSSIKPHLDALRDIAGFRISSALYARVLRDEGEES